MKAILYVSTDLIKQNHLDKWLINRLLILKFIQVQYNKQNRSWESNTVFSKLALFKLN